MRRRTLTPDPNYLYQDSLFSPNEAIIPGTRPRPRRCEFPTSIRLVLRCVLEDAPGHLLEPLPRCILLLPQSYYGLDTRSASQFESLVPPLDASNAGILVPKYHTLVEGLVHFIMYPPIPHRAVSFSHHILLYELLAARINIPGQFQKIMSEIEDEDCAWFIDKYRRRRAPVFWEDIALYRRQKTLYQSRKSNAETPSNEVVHQSIRWQDYFQTTLAEQHARLIAPRQLIANGIPCILWGEDALNFAHSVPVSLNDQLILVPDEQLDAAADVLEKYPESRYERTSAPNEDYYHFTAVAVSPPPKGVKDPKTTSPYTYEFPRSIRLAHRDVPEDDPDKLYPLPRCILLLPQSYYALDTRSESRFQSLVPPLDASNKGILVPKYHTLLEGLSHFMMYPPKDIPAISLHQYLIDNLLHARINDLTNSQVVEKILSEIQDEDSAWYIGKLTRENYALVPDEEVDDYRRRKELQQWRSKTAMSNKIGDQSIRSYSTYSNLNGHPSKIPGHSLHARFATHQAAWTPNILASCRPRLSSFRPSSRLTRTLSSLRCLIHP
ncbi:hypothetical protein BDN70DRAFT_55982 [Pholiota conissans]|uniref:Uncharacterized protein n=1 Tax=Pholiota conissans TaxID=109636 RepID=A0A9P6D6L9_9AGAR|nr:hypothetical protein BDN70DRAFT_55982 [Pholiota conissans]